MEHEGFAAEAPWCRVIITSHMAHGGADVPTSTRMVAGPAVSHDSRDTTGRSWDRFVLLPMIIAAVLLGVGNENFGFDSPGWIDPFMYLGYFWHYPVHAPPLDQDYKSSRLPWILPGYIIHSLADPVVASWVLVFSTLSGSGMALYLLVRDTTRDRAAAAIIAAAWTSCTWAHGIGGWNYHMLAAADYFLIASWLAFRAAHTGGRAPAVLSGVCAAAAVHTHLLFASFLPLLVLTYWSGLSGPSGRVARDAGQGLAGAAGITLILAAINRASGGIWLFFMPQVEQAQKLMRHDEWWQEAHVWLPGATYLIVPGALMLTGLAGLGGEGSQERRPLRVLVVQAWLALGLMCIAQFARHQATLNISYLAFPLYVYGFACGGATLATSRRRRYPVGLVAIGLLLVLGPLVLLMPDRLPRVMSTAAAAVTAAATAPVVPPLAFAVLGGLLTIATPAGARVLVFAGWFGVLNAWIAPAPAVYGTSTPGYRREMLELFREADAVTTAFDPRLDGIRYWFAEEHVITRFGETPLGSIFHGFIATRSWQYHLLAHDPAVPIQSLTLDQLDRTVCVGLLASPQTSGQLEAAFQAHFAALGRPLQRVTTRHFKGPNLAFDLTLLKPADASPQVEPPCARP